MSLGRLSTIAKEVAAPRVAAGKSVQPRGAAFTQPGVRGALPASSPPPGWSAGTFPPPVERRVGKSRPLISRAVGKGGVGLERAESCKPRIGIPPLPHPSPAGNKANGSPKRKKKKLNRKAEPECKGRSALFPGGGIRRSGGASRARPAVALPGRRNPP